MLALSRISASTYGSCNEAFGMNRLESALWSDGGVQSLRWYGTLTLTLPGLNSSAALTMSAV